jgi:hypothetical protein
VAASPSAIAEVLAGLRARSASLQAAPAAPDGHVAFGVTALDAALGGGLRRGRLSELFGPRSSGRLALALGALRSAQAAGELVAFVDVADALDPRAARAAGIALDRLLWVRPRGVLDGMKALDRVLDAGGFGAVVLYLCGVELPRRQTLSAPRLVRRAERARAAVLVVGDQPQLGSFAACTLTLGRARPRWSGGSAAPRIFDGICTTVEITRNKLAPPAAPVALRLAWG